MNRYVEESVRVRRIIVGNVELVIAEKPREYFAQATSRRRCFARHTATAQIMIRLRLLRQRALSIRLGLATQIARVLHRVGHRVGLVEQEKAVADFVQQVEQIDRVEELKRGPEEREHRVDGHEHERAPRAQRDEHERQSARHAERDLHDQRGPDGELTCERVNGGEERDVPAFKGRESTIVDAQR